MRFWHCLQQEAGEVPYHTVVGALRRIGPATRSPPAPRRGNSNSSKSDIEGNRECRKEGRAREEEQGGGGEERCCSLQSNQLRGGRHRQGARAFPKEALEGGDATGGGLILFLL